MSDQIKLTDLPSASAPASAPASTSSSTLPAGHSSKFKVGDRVVDTTDTDDEQSEAIVIDILPTPADEPTITIDGEATTIAALNRDFPPTDPVIAIVFIPFLDAHMTDWQTWDTASLGGKIREYTDEWGIPLQTYNYPESRLEPAE